MKNSVRFIQFETMGAKLLLVATILALLVSNSSWHDYYEKAFNHLISLNLGVIQFKFNLKFVINEILMSLFFLVVSLEIKYEFIEGSLNTSAKAALPIIAAIGGMVVPALIYVAFNYMDNLNMRGWAIPTATDIAFALGVLSLLGPRIAPSLKTFLTALAIVDDILAIVIIAFFYTDHISFVFLALSAIYLGLLILLNFKNVINLILYFIVGTLLWISLFYAGIHPMLAGVALAFSIPLYQKNHEKKSPLHKLSSLFHPIVALLILPLFAFANAGISIFNLSMETLHLSVLFGILVSLFLGKQLGIFGACYLAIKFKIAQLPKQVNYAGLYSIAVICGIGFTISLFIGTLAFGEMETGYLDSVKLGVLSGSLFSGVAGYILLFVTQAKSRKS